jgi:hypothetical protein
MEVDIKLIDLIDTESIKDFIEELCLFFEHIWILS